MAALPEYTDRRHANKRNRHLRRRLEAGTAMKDPRSILVTGGTSGIGEALALAYAAPGRVVALTGRDPERAAAVAAACRALGAEALAETIDAADGPAMAEFVARLHARMPLDLVIANAGVSAGTGGGSESGEQARRILRVNIDGVVNTVMPAIDCMLAKPAAGAKRRGQIAIMSSLAGFRGFPGAPAYCASKAAVKVWGEALRGELHAKGIGVSVICPGYVRSRMTEKNRFPMPFLMDAGRAARIIRRGLARNKARIAFPWPMHALVALIAGLPPGVTDPLFRRLPKKAAAEP
jgi:short-subunit dehydrogenase